MMEFPGYSPLCLELLTTFDLADDFSHFTCRMFGRDFTVTDRIMKRVFGFPLEGFRKPPPEFDAAEAWELLSGFNNWNSGGMPSGFIRDPALGILHKFIVYNISGNEQANKVNTVEVFLLTAALQNVKVSPTAFVFDAFQNIQRRSRCHPALPHIVTGLASHFKLIPPNGFPPEVQTKLLPRRIDLNELRGAPFAINKTTLVPHKRRRCVKAHLNSLAANPLSEEPTRTALLDDDGDDEVDPADPVGMATVWPTRGAGSSSSDFAQLREDLQAFRADWSTQWGQFQHDVYGRLDAQNRQLCLYQQQLEEHSQRLDAQNQQLLAQNRLWSEQNQQWALQQQQLADQNVHLAALEQQWANWTLRHDHPSTPPPDQQ